MSSYVTICHVITSYYFPQWHHSSLVTSLFRLFPPSTRSSMIISFGSPRRSSVFLTAPLAWNSTPSKGWFRGRSRNGCRDPGHSTCDGGCLVRTTGGSTERLGFTWIYYKWILVRCFGGWSVWTSIFSKSMCKFVGGDVEFTWVYHLPLKIWKLFNPSGWWSHTRKKPSDGLKSPAQKKILGAVGNDPSDENWGPNMPEKPIHRLQVEDQPRIHKLWLLILINRVLLTNSWKWYSIQTGGLANSVLKIC